MKVTKKQYEKALKDLPTLRKAEATIKAWNDGLLRFGAAAETNDVLAVAEDGTVTSKPKETIRVAKTG